MAPKTYLVCDVLKFNKHSYSSPIQQELEGLESEGQQETSLNLSDEYYYEGFHRYNCYHDYKHNRFGKVWNKIFNYYFEPTNFYLYYNETFKLILVSIKTDVGLDFIDKLNKSSYYEIKPIEIDFMAMYPFILEINGAWIANINQTYLKTAGYFGPHVNKSEEFKQAAKIGEVSSLMLKYVSPLKEEITIGISKKGSITLYDSFDRIEDEIYIILDIYNKLIRPTQSA